MEEKNSHGEKSTVYVFGRIGMRTVDGPSTPKITAHGIFAIGEDADKEQLVATQELDNSIEVIKWQDLDRQ